MITRNGANRNEIEMGQMEVVFGEIPQKLFNTNFTEVTRGSFNCLWIPFAKSKES